MQRARGRQAFVALVVLALFATGCKKRFARTSATTTAATAPVEKSASTQEEERKPATAKPSVPVLEPLYTFLPADGLRGPAAVIHDDVADLYLVSNVDGRLLEADGKGFISKLMPDGKKIFTRWIEGGRNKVVLNSPKGMALRGHELYVADIDRVRVFHRRTGAPLDEVEIPGSKYLSDVVVAPDGLIFVSDAGMKRRANGDGLEPSGTDSIYAIYRDGKSTRVSLVINKSLGGPIGLFATEDKVWTVGFRSGEIYAVRAGGLRDDIQRLPAGELDGIVGTGPDLLVASHAASAIFRGRPKGDWRIAIGDVKSPGGIGYDEKRKRALVPLFDEDQVRVYNLP